MTKLTINGTIYLFMHELNYFKLRVLTITKTEKESIMNRKLRKSVAFFVVIATVLSVSLNSFAWFPSKHASIINSFLDNYFIRNGVNYKSVVADAAKYADNEAYMKASSIRKVGTAYIISPYHAKSNLKCTTVQATSYTSTNGQGYSFSDVDTIARFLYGLAQKGIGGNTINLNQSSYSSNVNKRIVQDLQELIDTQFSGTTSNYKRGYIILGVFAHLVQDIYAHRARVTESRIKEMNADGYFSNYSGALADAKTYNGIPMIRLKDYLKGNDNDIYEDNPDYWTERIMWANDVTGELIQELVNGKVFELKVYMDLK